ncbi:hypothetical protein [Herbaspirillum camelliae]|uniref:hypothetical protein n=1 Tax=Herbaspirillum camelliae TaxID=1892903 RepID=UPI00117AC7B6|nr:hypothetical protein [Herbaspirillum camelliae]
MVEEFQHLRKLHRVMRLAGVQHDAHQKPTPAASYTTCHRAAKPHRRALPGLAQALQKDS